MAILLYILSAIIIIGGVFLLFATPVAGIIFILIGIGLIFWQKKRPTKKTATVTPADPEIEENIEKDKETHKVAGISHYTKNVESLGSPNPQYNYKVSEIIDESLEDERIYKTDFYTMTATLIPEPDNEYDQNAIAVLAEGKKIGYIKKESTSHIKKLMEQDHIKTVSCEIVGGSYKYYDSEEKHLQTKFLNYGARLTVYLRKEGD